MTGALSLHLGLPPGRWFWPPLWAFLLPCLFGLAFLPFAIGLLARVGMGQKVRAEGPAEHLGKAGTPTAGGAIVILLIAFGVLLVDRSRTLLPVLGALVLAGALGLVDDILTVRTEQRGLLARQRIVLQLAVGAIVALWFLRLGADAQLVPFLPRPWHMGLAFVPIAAVALAASANAFNLTDGSDGLAPGVILVSAFALALLARGHHHDNVAVVRLLLVTCGAIMAFLAYNLPPARVFLGGVGAEGIGMMIAAAAIAAGVMWFLPLLALVPLIETASVVIQVYVFKTTGRRFFRMSPIHHHFQLGGWGEWRVALTAWAVSAVSGGVALALGGRVP